MSGRPYAKKDSAFFKSKIPAIYQNQFFELTLWAWIQALRSQNISAKAAIIDYRQHFGLSEDDAPMSNCLMIYNRKHNEFLALVKAEGRALNFERDAPGEKVSDRVSQMELTIVKITEMLQEVTG